MELSRSRIDEVGRRLKGDNALTESDLRMLDAYFSSLLPYSEQVFMRIERAISLSGVGSVSITRRTTKTITSIREKLRRQQTKLSTIQDLVGCRIVVRNRREQDALAMELDSEFKALARTIDRREQPNHGYRAVHVVISEGPKRFEIQIRTNLQHLWASVVERLADKYGIEVKYGGGPEWQRDIMAKAADLIAGVEENEQELEEMEAIVGALEARGAKVEGPPAGELAETTAVMDEQLINIKARLNSARTKADEQRAAVARLLEGLETT